MRIRQIGPSDPLFDAWAQVFMTVGHEQWGKHTSAYPADELRAMWGKESETRHAFVAVEGEASCDDDAVGGAADIQDDGVDTAAGVVGAAELVLPRRDNTHLAFLHLDVLAPARRRGVGSALLSAAEEIMQDEGRTTVLVEKQTPVGQPDAAGAFLAARGFAQAQTCVRNAQRLPVSDAVAAQMRAALAFDDEYVVETAVDDLPSQWLEERARLGAMMSTDTPLGDVAIEPETWDAARVHELFDTARAQGRRVVEAVAWHRPSGQMAAFTHVSVPAETPWIAYQDDTLVEAAHRGHRLGYRVKAAVSLLLPQVAPGVEVQRTWNDETNTHVLRINSELGYEREGTMFEWQKRLA